MLKMLGYRDSTTCAANSCRSCTINIHGHDGNSTGKESEKKLMVWIQTMCLAIFLVTRVRFLAFYCKGFTQENSFTETEPSLIELIGLTVKEINQKQLMGGVGVESHLKQSCKPLQTH